MAKDLTANEETTSIKIHIKNYIYKDDKTNYRISIFKVIKSFGYNGVAMVKMLRTLELDIFTPYALNSPLIVDEHLRLFSRVLKGTAKTDFKEAIRDFQNQVIEECDGKAIQDISDCKQ